MQSDQLMGAGLTARILGKSVTALYQFENDGRLKPIRTVEGRRLYRPDEVRALAERLQAQNATSNNQ
jgi:DNA-binding transcriptional MerR regulator